MLTVEVTASGFRLAGTIDEHTDFSQFPNRDMELDLSGVRHVNSMGLVGWQQWRDQLTHKVTLRDVPVSFVNALSCIAGLADGMWIVSIRAPFIDAESGTIEEAVLDAKALAAFQRDGECPARVSPTTHRSMRLDDDPKQYLAFLTMPRAPKLAS